MFKVGDKAKGFYFNKNEADIGYAQKMDEYIGKVGVVCEVADQYFVIEFEDHREWQYPLSQAHLAKIEEDVIQTFVVGDRVKFKKSSIDSGMIDATEYNIFEIGMICGGNHIRLVDVESNWHIGHFEKVEEETMNNTEEQEIKWEVGQEVFCLSRGKGVVCSILSKDVPYPVEVEFEDTVDRYTLDGRMYDDHKNRVLFFSEPKIEAEKFPPKKPFVPVFKNGNVVIVKWADTTQVLILEEETERQVKGRCGQVWDKDPDVHFYKIGEEIIFN